MRKRLVAAVALAPLCLVVGGPALAQTTSTTPSVTVTGGNNVSTAAASSAGAADLLITGSVGSSSSTPAATLNSSNNIINSGSITLSGVNNSSAVQINTSSGILTGSLTNSGTIRDGESYTPSTNSNGFTEAPFASAGSSTRYGVQLIGKGLTGDILNSGAISAQGDSSAAILLNAPLFGSQPPTSGVNTVGLVNTGTISYIGDGGAAIQSTSAGTIGGNVLIEGAVTSQGTNSRAIDLEGAVSGRFSVYSSITSTGYSTTTRPATTSTLQSVQSNADQLYQSGGAVVLNGGVMGGVFIGAPPTGTTTSTAVGVDNDGDGVSDVAEGVGTIVNFGNAPALAIGNSGTAAVTIGAVGGTDETLTAPVETTPSNGYGIIIRGQVEGEGVYDGVTSTAIAIGSLTNGGPVNVMGGIRITGSVSADSYAANANAINILAGASVPEIRNEDYVEASVSTSPATGSNQTGFTPSPTPTATGVSISAGANVGTLSNYGTLQATAAGDSASATALVDGSGTLKTVLNEGVISAVVTPSTAGLVAPVGRALDLSNTTTGISLTQIVNPHPIAIEVSTTTSATGVVSTTAALTTATATTTTTTTTTTAGVTTTTTTTTPTYPQIIGNVLLGSGTNTVDIAGGSVTGALSLGGGANDSLTIDNGALFTGDLTNQTAAGVAGTGLALNVNNGTLYNTSTSHLNLSSLNIGAKGLLYASIDPSGVSTNTQYNVTGSATLAQGAQIGIILKSPLYTETTYTLITATQLNDQSGGALSSAAIPYVLVGTENSNAAAGTLSVDLRLKSTAELGLNPAESAAFNAVYSALPADPSVEAALLGQYTKASFLNVYDQMLPDYSGGVFELTLAASDAVTRATSRVNDIENPSGTRGAWAEEVAFGVNHNRSDTAGYQGGGFGFVGGLETGGAGLGAFGVTGSFLTGDIKDPHAPGDNLASFSEGEFGGYWQAQLGGFRADARLAGGYVLYSNRRELLLRDTAGDVSLDRSSKSSSSGYTATGHFGLGYQTGQIGLFYFRPQVHGDYFYLDQGSYTEHGGADGAGGDAFDLAVADRNGNEASGTASLVTGLTFGQGFRWRPELELGYRDVFSGTAGATTARFASMATNPNFTLEPDDIKGGGPVARLDVKADTDFYELNFEAGVEQRTQFTEGDLRLSVRVLF